jgi:hypothetical protein
LLVIIKFGKKRRLQVISEHKRTGAKGIKNLDLRSKKNGKAAGAGILNI